MPTKKKTAPKKPAASAKKAEIVTAQPKASTAPKSTTPFFSARNIAIIIVLLIVIIGSLLYVFRGMFIAATVNGQIITRSQLNHELEKKSGKTTLETLITKDLILTEMKKRNITVSDEEVNAELKKIQTALSAQGRTLDDALSQQGLSKDDLMDQIRIQKMIEKLFAKDITVSSKEIDAYIEQNKASIPEGQDEKTTRTQAEAAIKQQKLTSKFQTWLAGLQKNAKVQYYVNF